jgi:Ribonuclease G/E
MAQPVSRRTAYMDVGIGETRGVLLLDGEPERLILERDGADPADQPGARAVARIRRTERAFASAFVEMPGGADALMALRSDGPQLHEGQAVLVEVRTQARRGKSAVVRLIEPAEGKPRMVEAAYSLAERLEQWAKAAPLLGAQAREAADMAEEAALEVIHPLPGGGQLSIEPTRALVAIDVDLGDRPGTEAKRAARAANLAAFAAGARLLRLKALGGIVVFDLVGRGHDVAALSAAARSAFTPDNPGVAIGPISKFGTLELIVPRQRRPLAEDLLDDAGRPTSRTSALRLVRALEREGRGSPGGRLIARCDVATAAAFAVLAPALAQKLGARFSIEPQKDWPAGRLETAVQ